MPHVVTCILEHKGNILILKRSNRVGTYQRLWGGVAGFIEDHEEPLDTALKEIQEEVGISKENIRLMKTGVPIELMDVYEGKTYDWTIFPFLFHLEKNLEIHLDWEHTEYRWIHPEEIEAFDTVPHLKEVVLVLFEG